MRKKLVEKFINHPSYLDKGAGYLAKVFNTTLDDIYEAKLEAKQHISNNQESHLSNIISDQEELIAKLIDSKRTDVGSENTITSNKPLNPKQIEELVGVDNINTFVSYCWVKSHKSGVYTYSVAVKSIVSNFYTSSELKDKLKLLLPNITPKKIPSLKEYSKKALTIVISDDHVGMVNTTNIFDTEINSYTFNLLSIVQKVQDLGIKFEEVHICSLGDQLNGWNSQTTRGGHEVKSLSNKEQFDKYVEARRSFYDTLFMSGVSEQYFIHEMENSNHSGLGFSYMANKYLELYIEQKYPQVVFESTTDLIGGFEYGKHVVLYTHGKDEKFHKRPMPSSINADIDLKMYDFISRKGYNPKDFKITLYKGDLHIYGIQSGRFGRYVNCPSIAGPSDYGDINFGYTRAGCLLEILNEDGSEATMPLWFT